MKKKKVITHQVDAVVITEGIHGLYYYHLSKPEKRSKGLCGKDTMFTSIPISTWGTKSHLNERYCPECNKLYGQEL